MKTFQEFLNFYNGQKLVGTNSENRGECVGLIQVWLDNIAPQRPYIWGHAAELIINADKKYYDIIPNTPTGVPQKGDVVVWDKRFNGTYGHTAIATGAGDINQFEVFEQNNPLNSPCRLHTYPNYNFVSGWIRVRPVPVSSNANMYRGYDLSNPESMKIAVDMLIRVIKGDYVEIGKCLNPAIKDTMQADINNKIIEIEQLKNSIQSKILIIQQVHKLTG